MAIDPQQRALHELDNGYLTCRDLRHAWEQVSAWMGERLGRFQEVHRLLRCPRCDTERLDTYETPGWIRVRSQYHYPEAYLVKDQGGPVAHEEVRAEVFRRFKPRTSPPKGHGSSNGHSRHSRNHTRKSSSHA